MSLQLRQIKEIPLTLKQNEFERVLKLFVEESDQYQVPVNKIGFFNQLLENIASILIFKNSPHAQVWIAEDSGLIKALALTHITKDVDNSLCLNWVTAWVDPEYRRKFLVKEWYAQIKEFAKTQMCKHLVIVSSRNPKAYCRFLGRGVHPYAVLLKEDI